MDTLNNQRPILMQWANTRTCLMTAAIGAASSSFYSKVVSFQEIALKIRGWCVRLYKCVFVCLFEQVNQWPCPGSLFDLPACLWGAQPALWVLRWCHDVSRSWRGVPEHMFTGSWICERVTVQFGWYTAFILTSHPTRHPMLSLYCVLWRMGNIAVGNFPSCCLGFSVLVKVERSYLTCPQ